MYISTLVQSLYLEPGPQGLPDIVEPITGLVMYVKPFTFVPRRRQNLHLH